MRRNYSTKWDAKTTAHFVKLYKKQECLWNPLSEHYNFQRVRDFAINKIKTKMNKLNIEGIHLEPREVKNKIRSLRYAYLQQKRKVDLSREQTPNLVFRPKLFWYDAMDEIVRKIENKEPPSEPLKLDCESSDSDNYEAEYAEPEIETGHLSDVPNSNNEEERSNQRDCTPIQNSSEEMESPRRCKRLKSKGGYNQSVEQESDGAEFDIFGQSVAVQMKKLSLTQAIIAQHQIQSILSRCRINDIKCLQTNINTKRQNSKKIKREPKQNQDSETDENLVRRSKRKRKVNQNYTENDTEGYENHRKDKTKRKQNHNAIETGSLEDPLPDCDSKEETRRQIVNLFCEPLLGDCDIADDK